MKEMMAHTRTRTDAEDGCEQLGETQYDILDMQRLGKRQEFKV